MIAHDMVMFQYTSWNVFIVLVTLSTEVENQLIKGFQSSINRLVGKVHFRNISTEYVKGMELIIIIL